VIGGYRGRIKVHASIHSRTREKVVVQTFGIDVSQHRKRGLSLCSKNCVPNFRRSFAIDAKHPDFVLPLSDPMHKFDAGNDDRCIAKPFHPEHCA
jgi:hypothetical protein